MAEIKLDVFTKGELGDRTEYRKRRDNGRAIFLTTEEGRRWETGADDVKDDAIVLVRSYRFAMRSGMYMLLYNFIQEDDPNPRVSQLLVRAFDPDDLKELKYNDEYLNDLALDVNGATTTSPFFIKGSGPVPYLVRPLRKALGLQVTPKSVEAPIQPVNQLKQAPVMQNVNSEMVNPLALGAPVSESIDQLPPVRKSGSDVIIEQAKEYVLRDDGVPLLREFADVLLTFIRLMELLKRSPVQLTKQEQAAYGREIDSVGPVFVKVERAFETKDTTNVKPAIAAAIPKLQLLRRVVVEAYTRAYTSSTDRKIRALYQRFQRAQVDLSYRSWMRHAGHIEIINDSFSRVTDSLSAGDVDKLIEEDEPRIAAIRADADKDLAKEAELLAKYSKQEAVGHKRPARDEDDADGLGVKLPKSTRMIRGMMRPMENLVLTDLGTINTALSSFGAVDRFKLGVRQGDLVFRPQDKNTCHVSPAAGWDDRFYGIAAAARGVNIPGEKITFPIAMGGALSTYNRAGEPIAPFESFKASIRDSRAEMIDNMDRTVGSLKADKERGYIQSLGWSPENTQVDVIVYY